MFLNKLIIRNNLGTIREIVFHKGINLIVDETPISQENRTSSGNNVGKTTVLRLIDYCLGGDGKNIYQDTEFKSKTNTHVEHFLKDTNVEIALSLLENLEDPSAEETYIKRNFLSHSKKYQSINDEHYSLSDFTKKLKEIFFKSESDKPSFRQIISKNIRDEKNRLAHTVKVLHHNTTLEEYEALYLFWLGIDTDNAKRKDNLTRERKLEKKLQDRLKKETSLSQITQSLKVIDRSIEKLNLQRASFNVNEKFNEELLDLNKIKVQINAYSSDISRLETRRELIIESKNDLEGEISNINAEQIGLLYEKAQSLIPNLQVSFNETVRFHNEMVAQKLKYIIKELPGIEQKINSVKRELSSLLLQEKALSKSLNKSKAIDELQDIVVELNKQYENKGSLEEQKRLWEESQNKIARIDTELEAINKGIGSKDDLIQSRISEFNKYFSEISQALYSERFVLSAESNGRAYELNISSIEGNLGTGKKKGQIAAFDFAYILFADALDIEALHFILHDQIENIHDNQIHTLVDIANSINGQYIVPILRDKIPDDIDATLYEIVSLSQTDKLFKIE
jgi:uncharacterized protein YydD (DUF2326 family)